MGQHSEIRFGWALRISSASSKVWYTISLHCWHCWPGTEMSQKESLEGSCRTLCNVNFITMDLVFLSDKSWHKPFKHWFGTHLGDSTMCSFCFSLFFLLFGISAKTLSNIIKIFSTLLLQELHTVTRQCRLSHHDKIVPHDMWHTVVWKPNLVTCAVAEGLLTVAKTQALSSSGDYNCVLMLCPQRNLLF